MGQILKITVDMEFSIKNAIQIQTFSDIEYILTI